MSAPTAPPRIPAPRRPGMFCPGGQLHHCRRCGQRMHRGADARRICEHGHLVHRGRGLCAACYGAAADTGELAEYPSSLYTRDELLNDWRLLATFRGADFYHTFAPMVGITQAAWERAYQRARAAGHPLARRIDKER